MSSASLPGLQRDVESANFDKQDDSKHESTAADESPAVFAQRGHAATDKYGRILVHFDPAVEARIRRKIDWAICPIVAMLYLFCFIDVSSCLFL